MSQDAGQPLTNLYLAAAVIGVLSVISHFAVPRTSDLARLIGYALDILIAVVVGLIAIRAKRTVDRAALRASAAGAIFGLITGVGDLLFPPSAGALRSAMLDDRASISQSEMNAVINFTRSLGVRIFELIVAVLVGWLLALLIGWIVTLFVQGPDQRAI